MYIFQLISAFWPFLAVTILSNAVYAHASYSSDINRESWLYIVLCACCGLVSNVSWSLMMRAAKDNSERFMAGQIWDFIPIMFFCVLPPLFYSIGLSGWRLWAGIILIVAGTALIGYADKTI